MIFDNIEWLVVVVSVILAFALGFVWYADFAFGKTWRKVQTHRKESSYQAGMKKGLFLHVLALICFAILINLFAQFDQVQMLIWLTLGLIIFGYSGGYMNGESLKKSHIDNGHNFLMIVIMVLVNALL